MTFDRRNFLRLAAVAGAAALAPRPARAAADPISALGLNAAEFGVRPGTTDDQTAMLQRAIDQAASSRMPLTLQPGVYRVGGLTLPPGAQIVGVPGATRFIAARPRPIIASAHADQVRLSGLVFDGGGQMLPERQGLITLADGRGVRIADCELIGSGHHGIALERVGGEVSGNSVLGSADVAIFSLDARGLSITRNFVRRAGNNGIQVWRRANGEDGTRVIDNQVEEINALDGGSGQNGNGINVFRAGGVIVRGNRVRTCVFSAVRGNAASNIQIVGNNCSDLGEVAIYSEFGFEGAIISGNMVDGAADGISVTNFKEGGRLAVVDGNILRNLAPRGEGRAAAEEHGVGIYVEADTAVTGNVVEKAARAGIMAGWGSYLRDVNVTGNVVRATDIGIAVSVVAGAGAALIANNLISGAARGAIVGMDHRQPVTDDLAKSGAARYSQLAISGNRVN